MTSGDELPGVNRRLTCILAADAVGYSKAMSRDEEGTIRILEGHRAVIDSIIASHGGRIISTAGDSVLAEFTSAVAAVRCATEMQEALKTRNEKLPDDRRMLFRVGVNLGDVVVKGQDLLGDGVNVASRLESIAEPGGICIASSVYDQITGKLDLGFVDMGDQQLKNITRPIRAYHVGGARPAIPIPVSVAPAAPAPAPKNSTVPIVAGVVVVVLVGLAIIAAVAFDRSRATAERKPVASASSAAPVAPPPAAPATAPAPKPAPPPSNPASASSGAPKTDPTFAALAAGEAVATGIDGEWLATFKCAAYRDMPAGSTTSRASVRNGEFLVGRLTGRPARNNSLLLADSSSRFEGRLVGDRYVLDGKLGPRPCSLTLARAR